MIKQALAGLVATCVLLAPRAQLAAATAGILSVEGCNLVSGSGSSVTPNGPSSTYNLVAQYSDHVFGGKTLRTRMLRNEHETRYTHARSSRVCVTRRRAAPEWGAGAWLEGLITARA